MSSHPADPPRPEWRVYGATSESEDDDTSESEDAEESSQNGDEDSDVESSISVRAPHLDDAALHDILLLQEQSRGLPPDFSEGSIRSVAVVARSLETVDGVFTVGHTNSETHGNMIPMTSAEQNELFRLFTLYHIAYTENSTPSGQGYGVRMCHSHTGGPTYTLVRAIPDSIGQPNNSDTDESRGFGFWGDTSGTEERTTRADHLRMRLEGVITRLTEAQRSREDAVSSDEE